MLELNSLKKCNNCGDYAEFGNYCRECLAEMIYQSSIDIDRIQRDLADIVRHFNKE